MARPALREFHLHVSCRSLMNATAPLDILLQSLANADWDGYVRHLRQIESVDGQEALLADLGRRHSHGVDVLKRLRAWPRLERGLHVGCLWLRIQMSPRGRP
jgi:hypothetical protein